jgi:hypothetical protein
MNYQKIYDNITRRGQTRILEGYSEKHHIIPRCMGGTDEATNLVSLTPEEHYLCHLLLVKIHPNNIRLVKAAMFLTSSPNNSPRNNKLYGWLKRQYSEYMRGPNNPSKIHGAWNKVNFSDKTIESMSERMKTKNPCAGVKPWNHPRATEITKALWKRADEIYNIWITNNKPSYCKLYGLTMNKNYNWETDGKEAGPFMNMVKYFRKGWIPTVDIEWTQYK